MLLLKGESFLETVHSAYKCRIMNRITAFMLLLVLFFASQGLSKGEIRWTQDPPPIANTIQDSTKEKIQKPLVGIDLSHYQKDVNWSKIKKTGISFVFVKATGGIDYVDPQFHQHWEDAKNEDILRGTYHFYYEDDTPEEQAHHFIESVLHLYDSTDLPPVLDLERHGVESGRSVEDYQEGVKQWLQIVEKAFYQKPMIYASTNFANTYLNDTAFSSYHLWLAEYGVVKPVLPDTWKKKGWTFWQYSSTTTVSGVHGLVDGSYFSGGIERLKEL